jgi:alpha-galactosidase
MRTLHDWGYKLIKHDFTSFDIMGRWSYDMGMEMTNPGWSFYDRSQTTAEIVLNMYKVIREAVKDSLIIGCNTFGHLTAGLFELQRTGDDTSGMEWERTRKMGVNTLAFRAAQHGAFFATDADCIGLTRKVPWEMNQRWLDVLAKSGTPLFISAEPEAMGAEQVSAVKKAFARASMIQPVGEPLDWLYTTTPRRWKFGEELIEYVWDI